VKVCFATLDVVVQILSQTLKVKRSVFKFFDVLAVQGLKLECSGIIKYLKKLPTYVEQEASAVYVVDAICAEILGENSRNFIWVVNTESRGIIDFSLGIDKFVEN